MNTVTVFLMLLVGSGDGTKFDAFIYRDFASCVADIPRAEQETGKHATCGVYVMPRE